MCDHSKILRVPQKRATPRRTFRSSKLPDLGAAPCKLLGVFGSSKLRVERGVTTVSSGELLELGDLLEHGVTTLRSGELLVAANVSRADP